MNKEIDCVVCGKIIEITEIYYYDACLDEICCIECHKKRNRLS